MDGRFWWIFAMVLLVPDDQLFSSIGRKGGCQAYSHLDEERLLKNLTGRCRKSIRPVFNSSVAVAVHIGITFHHVIDVDENKQLFKSSVWIRQEWKNEILSWDPSEYGGVESIVVPAQDVWLPDIVLHNNVFEEFDGRLDNVVTRIEMFHNGRSLWLAPFVFLTSCKIDVSNFPFDEQTCILKFSSWVYSGKKLNLTGMGNKTAFLSDKRVSNGEWEVVSIPVVRQVRFYEALPDVPYPEMIFKIHLKRRSLFYIVNLVIPNFLITLLAFFSFFIPAECGERISFIITVLLSMTVFLLLVAENIPPTSDAVPVISVFFTASIVEVSLALIATGVTLRINYSYLFGKRHLSPKFKRFLFKTLGPTLAVDTSSVIETKEKEDVKQERKAFRDFRKAFRRRRKRSSGEEGELGMNSLSVETAKPNGGSRAVRYIPSMSSSSSEENNDSYCSCSGFFSQEKVNRGATAADVEYRTNELSVIAEGVNVIARVFEDQNNDSKRALECKMAASVVDRAFMCLFVLVFIVSSITIMLLPLTRT